MNKISLDTLYNEMIKTDDIEKSVSFEVINVLAEIKSLETDEIKSLENENQRLKEKIKVLENILIKQSKLNR
jgi:hypothetical protein